MNRIIVIRDDFNGEGGVTRWPFCGISWEILATQALKVHGIVLKDLCRRLSESHPRRFVQPSEQTRHAAEVVADDGQLDGQGNWRGRRSNVVTRRTPVSEAPAMPDAQQPERFQKRLEVRPATAASRRPWADGSSGRSGFADSSGAARRASSSGRDNRCRNSRFSFGTEVEHRLGVVAGALRFEPALVASAADRAGSAAAPSAVPPWPSPRPSAG